MRLVGLLSGTSYTFCLLVHTPQGEALGPASTFTTAMQPPMIGEPSTPHCRLAQDLVAAETNARAGALTDLSVLFQRDDDQQRIENLSVKEPEGLGAIITGIPLCPEPQASQGTCPLDSQIGHVVVTSGPGADPLVSPPPGAAELPIYLTGPYKGAPFGLSILTSLVSAPFTLVTTIRARVESDPHTVQISVVTDPLPQEVDGLPPTFAASPLCSTGPVSSTTQRTATPLSSRAPQRPPAAPSASPYPVLSGSSAAANSPSPETEHRRTRAALLSTERRGIAIRYHCS